YLSDDHSAAEWDLDQLNKSLLHNIPLKPVLLTEDQKKSMTKNQLKHQLKEEAIKLYEAKEAQFPDSEQMREIERVILLRVIDTKWMNHIDDMEQLRQGIGLQAYGQRDPLVEYRMAGFDMFDEMTAGIQQDTVRLMYGVKVEQKVEREEVVKVTGTNKDDTLARAPKRREDKKVYPNDPCPCGSGKKYKQCCGRK
ncbi:MAG: SEC-C domain-containing protein, partial [Lachnospiraceae bacterium]|nr:SEC-C domain-containing protein [Lachnospiraceae bacterium]